MGMRINAITQPITAELRKIESTRKTERENRVGKASTPDKSAISEDAKKLSETQAQFETIASSLAVQPEIRSDRIDDVKRKIESGYYNSDEFVDKLADKLLKQFGIESL
jgi:flagellar biosynthesis anti-sigma factor FlgM